MHKEFYIVFSGIRYFLKAQAQVEALKLPHRVVTTPHELAGQCGMALLFDAALRPQLESILSPSDAHILYLDKD